MSTSKVRYTQKFRKVWLTYTDLKDWLEEVNEDETKSRCKVCDTFITAKLHSIIHHSKAVCHKRKLALYYNPSKVEQELNNIDKDENEDESFIKSKIADKLLKLKSIGWTGVCLVCLRKNRRILRPIFQNDSGDIMISDKISECSTFKVQFDMNIPHNICMECYQDLKAAYRFRKNCEKSYKALEKFICEKNTISETVEDFVETLPEHDNEIENINLVRKRKNYGPLRIANTTIIRKKCEKKSPIDVKEELDDKDDCDNIVGTFLKENDFYIREEHNPSDGNDSENDKEDEKDDFEALTKVTKKEKRERNTCTTDEKPVLICHLCGNLHKTQYSLTVHMKRHFNIKSHVCEVCKKSFFTSSQLTCHMRTHSGERPYKCKYCGKKFSDYGSRQRHERTHTGERPYKCELCQKTFAYPKCLKVHMRVHGQQE